DLGAGQQALNPQLEEAEEDDQKDQHHQADDRSDDPAGMLTPVEFLSQQDVPHESLHGRFDPGEPRTKVRAFVSRGLSSAARRQLKSADSRVFRFGLSTGRTMTRLPL